MIIGCIYQGSGDEIKEIDITDIIKNTNTMEEVVNRLAKKYIKNNVKTGMSMGALWKGNVYRYIWVNEKYYDDTILKNHIGMYLNVTKCFNEGEFVKQLIYRPGKIILVKHDTDEYNYVSMDNEGKELFYRYIEKSNQLKKGMLIRNSVKNIHNEGGGS